MLLQSTKGTRFIRAPRRTFLNASTPWEYEEDDPIHYAYDLLEAYESEIAGAIERGELANGFLQGRIFLGARKDIQRKVAAAAVSGHAYADSVPPKP